MDDADLVARALLGMKTPGATLYRKYSTVLLAKIRPYLRHGYDAEDVLQEAFRRAFQKLSTLEDLGKFPGWIRRIACNCAIGWQRQLDSAKQGGKLETVPIDRIEVPMPGTDESEGLITKRLVEDIRDILGEQIASIYLLSVAHGLPGPRDCGESSEDRSERLQDHRAR